jgi:hypothetical protein
MSDIAEKYRQKKVIQLCKEAQKLCAESSFAAPLGLAIDDAIRERDAYFAEAARTKETLAEIIPALEIASKCNADELRKTCPVIELTPDEWAALWMARAILEVDSETPPTSGVRKPEIL